MSEDRKNVIVYSSGMKKLALSVQKLLSEAGVTIAAIPVIETTFANGEVCAEIPVTIRHQHVFFFQDLQWPDPNIALMRMFVAADAMLRSAVGGISLVIPYIPYLRQDRKNKPRVPISARMLANFIETNREIKHIITVDMHADQIQGFFSIAVDNLTAMGIFAEYVRKYVMNEGKPVVAVAPDVGAGKRTRGFAKRNGLPITIVEKNRPEANVAEVVSVMGENVKGATIIIPDDIGDTGGTLRGVMETLMNKQGAADAGACITHGIWSGNAAEKFAKAGFKIVTTDSIPRDEAFLRANPWLIMLSLDKLLADALGEHMKIGGSVSSVNGS